MVTQLKMLTVGDPMLSLAQEFQVCFTIRSQAVGVPDYRGHICVSILRPPSGDLK